MLVLYSGQRLQKGGGECGGLYGGYSLIAHVFGHATSLRVCVICAHVHCGADQK